MASDTSVTKATAPRWDDVTLADVYRARDLVMPHVHRTGMITSQTLNHMTNTDLFMKAELFQKTGSFKVRGAMNAIMQLTEEQKARGIVTMSAGNHGQGIAYAARMVGCRAVVFMPETAVPTKVEAIRGYGADARFAPSMETLFDVMQAYQQEHGLTYISPYNHPNIIAGQGIIGLEILEDVPDVETVVVPVGGGGLISGIAMAIKSLRPDVRIVGVEPDGANIVKRSLEAGRPLPAEHISTIADGLAAPAAGDLTQEVIAHYVDDMVLVSDEDIAESLCLILSRCKVMPEPAGAAAVAALLTGKAAAPLGGRTVAILSGGNIDAAKLAMILAE